MTLDDLKDYWKDLSLSHKDVKQFSIGSWYNAAESTDDKYPLVWWEFPYVVNYNQEFSKRVDSVIVSFSVFLSTKQDDVIDSHRAISFAKSIGDAIITKARMEATEFKITNVNAVSVREYSDDYVAGMRYDITLSLLRDICEADINDYFNE